MDYQKLGLFIRLSRPYFLLGAALMYALGVGIARYLGAVIDWNLYLLGQVWVSAVQLSTHYLNEYFDSPADVDNQNRTPFSGGSGMIGPGKLARNTALMAAATTLTIAASVTMPLLQAGRNLPLLIFYLVIIFLLAFFYSTPPMNLASSGYGELTTSILVANLVPGLAFLLQYGDLHRLLMTSTFPLIPLHIAMLLAFELPDYASDLKNGKKTMLVRVGWERGMQLHNLMVLSAFLLLAIGVSYGLSMEIALPAFLPLPFGMLQIWQMRRIAQGMKPNWTALTLGAVALLLSTAYLLTFAFWTR